MELTGFSVTLAQALSIIAFILMVASLWRAIEIHRFLRDRPGDKLSKIVVGVLLVLCLVQGVTILNTVLIGFGVSDFHRTIRALEQGLFIIGTLWAWRRLEQLR